jgi:16S rRNA (guanine1207-N2)-methyltransferase
MVRRKKRARRQPVTSLPEMLGARIRPPAVIVLGTPSEAADLVAALPFSDVICYQMDLFPAGQLRRELEEFGLEARVAVAPDLWDLPADFQTAIYLPAHGGERQLKIDMVEQAFHVLRPQGTFLVWSPYEADQAFPGWLKKVFGKVHTHAAEGVTAFRCQRAGDRPRRRHEVAFQAKVGNGPSLRFVSRPGVFSFGRFDDGARALVETMKIRPGDRVLDIGCGVGTNGIFAARRSGEAGFTAFVDSNVRAAALAESNARANGLTHFEAVASATVAGLSAEGFDVALANPPYYAYSSIAALFIERSRALLKPGGRFYLVTKQPEQVGPLVEEVFGTSTAVLRRGYTVLSARCPSAARRRGRPTAPSE